MTPARFAQCLHIIGWSKRQLALSLGCDTNLPTWWGRGTTTVPDPIGDRLERLAACHEENWPPEGWRKKGQGV